MKRRTQITSITPSVTDHPLLGETGGCDEDLTLERVVLRDRCAHDGGRLACDGAGGLRPDETAFTHPAGSRADRVLDLLSLPCHVPGSVRRRDADPHLR